MKPISQYQAWASDLILRRFLTSGVPLDRVGTDYGGYHVPLARMDASWIVYSVGIGEDASFDLGLIERVGCRVRAFDPTPRSAAYVRSLVDLPAEFRFQPVAIWKRDGEVPFYAPRDPAHVSHSIDNLQRTDTFVTVPARTIGSALHEAGDDRIDLLKLDAEGAEYAILAQILGSGIRPRVICAELHSVSPARNLWLAVRLRLAGYRLAWISQPGPNVTFVRF